MKKRLLAMILTLSALLGMMVMPAAAAEEEKEENPEYAVYLPDGTEIEEAYLHRFLVPQGETAVVVELKKGDKAVNVPTDEELKPDEGTTNRYTIQMNDYMLYGSKFLDAERTFLSYKEYSEKKEEVSEEIKRLLECWTKNYSKIKVYNGKKRSDIDICWQVKQPEVLDIKIDNAARFTPVDTVIEQQEFVIGKTSDNASIYVQTDKNTVSARLLNENLETVSNAVKKESDGYSFEMNGESETLVLELKNTLGYKKLLSFCAYKRLLDTPDAVTDYLCIGSQYTAKDEDQINGYGLMPERTLVGQGLWNTCKSLGNFGGYITYYYDEPIKNNPNNPYGVDFIVYGNSNGGSGFSEPGNVLVSKDGETWYTLAGSEHYEDNTYWDYAMTYQRVDEATLANGELLEYGYPRKDKYPMYNWTDEAEQSITLRGTFLNKIFPAFGYADVRINAYDSWGTGEQATLTMKSKNPYGLVTTREKGLDAPDNLTELYEGAGDSFDISWAVDENGLPVELDEIHYIKVQTATMVDGGFGEKSTEVNAVVRVVPGDADVGVSAAPESITVAGEKIALKDGVYEYTLDKPLSSNFTVAVEAGAAANVYIGNLRSNTREYLLCPQKKVIRIIFQEDEKAPLQYFIQLTPSALSEEYVSKYVNEAVELAGKNENEAFTRAMLCLPLYTVLGELPYNRTDIKEANDYGKSDEAWNKAIMWSVNFGIYTGYTEGTKNKPWGELGLEDMLTRAQCAVILHRYSTLGVTTSESYSLNCKDTVPDWAADSVAWAISDGILKTDIDGNFNPNATMTAKEVTAALTNVLSQRW